MLLPIFGLYFIGGFVSGVFMCVQYVRFAVRKQPRTPWSIFLGVGLSLLITGIALIWFAQYTPQKNYSWQDGWGGGLFMLSPLIFLIGVIPCIGDDLNKKKIASQSTIEEDEGTWPPPPTNTPL